MSEKTTTLEKSNQLYTDSQLFNSLDESYKLIQFKILNSIQLSEDESDFYNNGIDEIGNVILSEILSELSEIKVELKEVRDKINTKTISKTQKKTDIESFKQLATRQIRLFDKKKALVAEADSLQIKTYF